MMEQSWSSESSVSRVRERMYCVCAQPRSSYTYDMGGGAPRQSEGGSLAAWTPENRVKGSYDLIQCPGEVVAGPNNHSG